MEKPEEKPYEFTILCMQCISGIIFVGFLQLHMRMKKGARLLHPQINLIKHFM
jgi:hypothetical protein